MRDGDNSDSEGDVHFSTQPANGKSNGKENGTSIKNVETGTKKEEIEDRDEAFKDFTPMSKKRRVAHTPPSQIATSTTSTATATTPPKTPFKTPSKTPSKYAFGTPVSRQQYPLVEDKRDHYINIRTY